MQNEPNNALDREDVPHIEPCKHMENNISALSDGSLRGFALWYTQLHAAHCPHCGPPCAPCALCTPASVCFVSPLPHSPIPLLQRSRRTALQKAMEAADEAPHS